MYNREQMAELFSQLPESEMLQALNSVGVDCEDDQHYLDSAYSDPVPPPTFQEMRAPHGTNEKPDFSVDYGKIFKEAQEERQARPSHKSLYMNPGTPEDDSGNNHLMMLHHKGGV